MGGACEWPVSYAGCNVDHENGLPASMAGLSEDDVQRFETLAADYLHAWTGFGLCPVTIRPCRQDCTAGVSTFTGFGAPFTPVLIAGQMFNIGCGRCGDNCGCGHTPSLRLPGPVDSIIDVIVDGKPVDPAGYRVDNNRLLVRLDGADWPVCQDLTAGSGEEGSFVIDYLRGRPVPEGGQLAAGVLAEQFAKAFCNDSTCQLPRRVQSITRQGVSVAILDSFDDIARGHTGIWVVDSWVASVTRPGGSRVFSPDLAEPRARVQTWPRTRTSGDRMTTTITRRPTTANLALYAGDDFVLTITVRNPDGTPADLSAAVVRAYIRQRAQDVDVAGEFYPTVDGNVITLQLPGTVSAELPPRAVWDCEMVTGGRTTTLVAGTIRMTAEVTR